MSAPFSIQLAAEEPKEESEKVCIDYNSSELEVLWTKYEQVAEKAIVYMVKLGRWV